MSTLHGIRYTFDDVVIDAENYRVYKGGQLQPIGPRAFDLLLDLVAHPRRVVEKQELFDRVWHGVAVTDNALTRAVKDLRRAIGDRANAPKYLETASRRGYRFVADVRELRPGRRVTALVLPFDDLSATPQGYLAGGLADELIAQLGRANPDQLTVIGRASASAVHAGDRSWAVTARQLGVDYAVKGTVRCDGDRTRVSVQLIRVVDEELEWAGTFNAERATALDVLGTLGAAIATGLRVQLAETAATDRDQPVDPDAHAAFLEGRHFLRQRTADSMANALAAFERATARQPTYARAHVGAAHSHSFALMAGGAKAAALDRARVSIGRALALDDRLAEAHTVLALLQSAEWQFTEAERSLRWAIALDPNEPQARHWLAMFPLVVTARFEEALDELRRARRLDPLSLIISADIAGVLCMTRQFDLAVTQCAESLRLDPHFARAHVYLGWARAAMGRYDTAVVALETAARLDRTRWTSAWLGYAYGKAGRDDKAREVLGHLLPRPDDASGESPFYLGLVHAGLGDADQAVFWFERSVAERSLWAACLGALPLLDGLRSDARFLSMLERIRELVRPGSTGQRPERHPTRGSHAPRH